METSQALTETNSSQSILLLEDSPVRTSVTPEEARESMEHGAGYGPRCSASFAWYDLDSCSWRTYQRSLLEGWSVFLDSWPKSGMTRNGRCYQHAPWVRHICGRECSLLPTPRARDAKQEGYHAGERRSCPSLPTVAQRLQRGPMNPAYPEWVMGFPPGWTELEA